MVSLTVDNTELDSFFQDSLKSENLIDKISNLEILSRPECTQFTWTNISCLYKLISQLM